MVAEVITGLPEPFRARFSNVAVVVEEWPDEETDAQTAHPADAPSAHHPDAQSGHHSDSQAGHPPSAHDTDLLGLYQGIPYGERQTDYNLVLPDRITIYRQPILAASRTEAEAREEIRLTVLHEIGHYFGLGDHELP